LATPHQQEPALLRISGACKVLNISGRCAYM